MKQTGTLYSKANNESSVEIKEPIPNVFIYFSQNSVRKLTAKTNAAGKFDFDLPLGKYQVAVSSGATSQVYQLAGGSEFELITTSKVGDFEKWVLAPAYINTDENPLVVLLKSLADSAKDSAVKAKSDADRAKVYANGMQVVESSLRDDIKKKQDKLEFVGTGGVMREGAYGIGGISLTSTDGSSVFSSDVPNGIYSKEGIAGAFPMDRAGTFLKLRSNTGQDTGIFTSTVDNWGIKSIPRAFLFAIDASAWRTDAEFYTSVNTTIDSNGFIKAASPIIRLFNDRIETNGQFVEEPIFERLDTGVYKVSNTLGLAREGWYIETPKNKNGLPYFMVDWEQDEESHDVIVRVFKKKLDLETLDFVNGELVDIGQDQRWIDLRFHEEDNRGE